MKYYSIGEFAEKIGKTPQTLRNWDKSNILKPSHVTNGGTRYYSQEQLNHFLGIKNISTKNKRIIGYCRVSSHKQKDDLERQIVTVFSCRLPGKRANKAKKMIKELIENDTSEKG